jgi:hypothetical protein
MQRSVVRVGAPLSRAGRRRARHRGWLSPGALGVFVVSGVLACGEELVESVSPDVCASGKRWVGEFTPSEEMYPGQDCVACHRVLDGPPLLAAGTVYGLPDPGGARTTGPLCFGVEGASVTITMGDGEVLHTTTNRAGNFYFEGQPEGLVTPFRVDVELTLQNGHRTRQSMKTQPSYGGCARCHGPSPTPTPGVLPGGAPAPEDIIADVYPIWTGPVVE